MIKTYSAGGNIVLELAIIIPGYNCGKHIKRCLDSIIVQDVTDYDIFFIDDGSTDSTRSIVAEYGNHRVHYYRQENSGVSSARNYGLTLARKYRLIMFIDADDWLEPGCLKSFLNISACDFAFCNWNEYTLKNDKVIVSIKKIDNKFNPHTDIADIVDHFLRSRSGGSPWGKLYCNDIIQSYNIKFIENLPYAEDYLFNLSYLKHVRKVYYIDLPLYAYNCMQEGARAKFRKNRLDLTIQVETVKFDLYNKVAKERKELMTAELIEQMAIASINLRSPVFTKKERINERVKLFKYLQYRGLDYKDIAISKAGLKEKIFVMLTILLCNVK